MTRRGRRYAAVMRRRPRAPWLALLLLLWPGLSSCGAIGSRISLYAHGSAVALSGAQFDWVVLTDPESTHVVPRPTPFWQLCALVDLVPSLALDVVLSPVDLAVWLFGSGGPPPAGRREPEADPGDGAERSLRSR